VDDNRTGKWARKLGVWGTRRPAETTRAFDIELQILPNGDATYAEESATFNLSVPNTPAVRFARQRNLPVGVLATGHQVLIKRLRRRVLAGRAALPGEDVASRESAATLSTAATTITIPASSEIL
jgi:hypothetical protein